MTMPSDVTVIETAPAATTGPYVDWPAIIAGIVLASGISLVLLTFGSAIGLSFANFRSHEGVSPIWIGIAAASWLLWVQISSFMAGGYLTGRLRRRADDATEHEVDVRDGAHGLLVWGGALVLGAFIATSGIGGAISAIGGAAATVTNAASNLAGGAAEAVGEAVDPNAYFVDTLFRPAPAAEPAAPAEGAAPAETVAAPAEPTAEVPSAGATPAAPAAAGPAADDTAIRAEIGRIFARAGDEPVPDADRAYLSQVVAERTGLAPEAAQARVDEVMTAVDTARQQAADAAETARKTGILAAFLIAASFLVSAAGAYWAAQMGGNHRDQGTIFPGFARRR